MDHIEKVVTGFLLANNNPVGFLILGLAAMLEYVFPPFPGDMVTLFGAFLVAGMAGLRARAVLFWALVSAAAWNGLVVGAGHAAGANWERLKSLASTYSLVAWSLLGVALAGWLIVAALRRREK